MKSEVLNVNHKHFRENLMSVLLKAALFIDQRPANAFLSGIYSKNVRSNKKKKKKKKTKKTNQKQPPPPKSKNKNNPKPSLVFNSHNKTVTIKYDMGYLI